MIKLGDDTCSPGGTFVNDARGGTLAIMSPQNSRYNKLKLPPNIQHETMREGSNR